jgi:hypothetical protein
MPRTVPSTNGNKAADASRAQCGNLTEQTVPRADNRLFGPCAVAGPVRLN